MDDVKDYGEPNHESDTSGVQPRTKLSLGQLTATPGAIRAMATAGQDPAALLARHRAGDWGDLAKDDRSANDLAVRQGGRVLSAYVLADGTRIWIVTEADRRSTCLLLPAES